VIGPRPAVFPVSILSMLDCHRVLSQYEETRHCETCLKAPIGEDIKVVSLQLEFRFETNCHNKLAHLVKTALPGITLPSASFTFLDMDETL
jgi:hypothetical protein